jgi:hypothetical protein
MERISTMSEAEARRWIGRRLRWEARLTELRRAREEGSAGIAEAERGAPQRVAAALLRRAG